VRPEPIEYAEASAPSVEARPPRTSGWLKPALVGFALGVGVSQALGIWTFASHLVHGVPMPGFNGAATIARTLDPEGWERVSAKLDRGDTGNNPRYCVALTLPERGLEAGRAPCPTTLAGDLQTRSGEAPRGARLALARPLFATTERRRAAPVAGWAAQVGNKTATTTVATDDTASANPTIQAPAANGWATSTFSSGGN
jgi:hypothetical protein